MNSATIRRKFLEFFASKGHQIVPSAPLVLKNDPTLLFTNSGMVQFKDYFLGNSIPPSKRIADTQKCLRVSGKHNDLEDVGLDTYHHTMFEMLGNWSFGNYFKADAIAWAWELLTNVYGLPPERLYVTVFGGDQSDNLPVDEEAESLWMPIVGKDRVLHGKKKDNFWEMGEMGPCGPCSEIHIDLRPEEEVRKVPGRQLVNTDNPLVVEIWNLVFIQFNRLASGALEPLPDKHVDTGMGFERLCMAIQGRTSTYETDVFSPLMEFISKHAGVSYGANQKTDVAIRVMADHIRAVSFAIADGQLPSNTGAGYVIRRILRRAVRYGFSYLNFKEPFLHRLTPLLAAQMKEAFPELQQQVEYVTRVIHEEEQSFLRTLELGIRRFEGYVGAASTKEIAGDFAFELNDTYGFPIDLTSLLARERGFTVDLKGFEAAMQVQKERSRTDATKETGDWTILQDTEKPEFIGYEHLQSESRLIKYRKVKQKNKELYQLVFDKTPFYAESGGQVGDTGIIKAGPQAIAVLDTRKENELIIHLTEQLPADPSTPMELRVDERKRRLTMNNHSATHLLHAALRRVLGKHVEQKGSLVSDQVLRFDFSHFAAMTPEEIEKVESLVNEKIRENIGLDEQRNVPLEKAKSMGAMALFGEKYGEYVRVITFDPGYSVELCGGTHVKATGNIGFLKIISESSVAAGVRRIEAVTADGAREYINRQLAMLQEVKTILRNPKDLVSAVGTLVEERQYLEKQVASFNQERANQVREQLAARVKEEGGTSRVLAKVSLPDAEAVKNVAYGLRNQFENLLMVLAAEVAGKPMVAVMIGEKLAQTQKYHAGNLVKELAKEIDGGGGGQPFYATAGGKNLLGLDQVLVKAEALLR
ncbi:MAG: alanine--tRNA ligase [Cyclobacteriaceae bacterium]|nr:alanine--tRNA ligase [Cyclobacteriaceae bacterium]